MKVFLSVIAFFSVADIFVIGNVDFFSSIVLLKTPNINSNFKTNNFSNKPLPLGKKKTVVK